MGSSSSSYSSNQSSTSYQNTPQTQEGDNPLALANANSNQIGGQGNINGAFTNTNTSNLTLGAGAQINSYDGGVIERAFAFGTDVISKIADMTRQQNSTVQKTEAQTLGFNTETKTIAENEKIADTSAAIKDAVTSKGFLIVGGLVIAYFVYKKGFKK